ncbi:hypothetical protein [Clostridium saccharoperbutylacetonicum]|uniref:hypothetical protein n=1 Tax=Clostridium saccharoperbutylacetonicum TaxID=36745 RepID=UPI00098401BD|nr:hypothetical protein [Clostridium saccharoperbutylacetonicum]AQR93391.1 hypothetical protein CLSAP_06890 [Clostridium saccharoperbutylacetonicum]NSB29088.1 hypothetical protein [Clostridium saccharoperbutylacetonicum]
MKSIELLNRLTKEQKELLERATGGEPIKKDKVTKIRAKLKKMSEEDRFWEWTPVPNDNSRMWGSLSAEAEENFNNVCRYLNSLEVDEETRKQKAIEIADIEYNDFQKYIYRCMNLEEGTIEEIKKDIFDLENNLITKLGVNYGFTYEDVSRIVKREFDFSKNELYKVEKLEINQLMSKLFG